MNAGWLLVAFLAAGLLIGAYVVSLAARRRRLEERVDELDRLGR